MKPCRLCGHQHRNGSSGQRNIFNDAEIEKYSLADLINKYIHLKISEGDRLPQDICNDCYKRLTEWHVYAKKCKKMQIKFMRANNFKPTNVETGVIPKPSRKKHKKKNKSIINNEPYPSSFLPSAPSSESHRVYENNIDSRPTQVNSSVVKNNSEETDTIRTDLSKSSTSSESIEVSSILDNIKTIDFDVLVEEENNRDECIQLFNAETKEIQTEINQDTEVRTNIQQLLNKDVVLLQCRYCEKTYTNKRTYGYHVAMHENPKEYCCDYCSRVFYLRGAFRNHIETHAAKYEYCCDVCGQMFRTSSSFRNHFRLHRGGLKHTCHVCNKAFKLPHQLDRHLLTHSDARPHKCAECPLAFALRNHLTRHTMTVHAQTQARACPMCGKEYRYANHYRAHLLRHAGQRDNKCNVCDKSFITRNDLMRHERTHTREKPFKCTLCSKTFADCSNRKRHILSHAKTANLEVDKSVPKSYASLETFFQSPEVMATLTTGAEDDYVLPDEDADKTDYERLELLPNEDDVIKNEGDDEYIRLELLPNVENMNRENELIETPHVYNLIMLDDDMKNKDNYTILQSGLTDDDMVSDNIRNFFSTSHGFDGSEIFLAPGDEGESTRLDDEIYLGDDPGSPGNEEMFPIDPLSLVDKAMLLE